MLLFCRESCRTTSVKVRMSPSVCGGMVALDEVERRLGRVAKP